MKRYILLTAALLTAIMMTGCGKPPKIDSGFSVAFTAQKGEETYSGTLTKSDGAITIVPTSPYTVQDVSFLYQDGKLDIRCADHSTEAPGDYLPRGSLPRILYTTMSNTELATYVKSEADTDRYLLPSINGNAALTARNGIPLSLTDPGSGWKIRFDAEE